MPESLLKIEKKKVLETLERARDSGIAAIRLDNTTLSTDDQDCYPRGLQLNIDRSSLKWLALRLLSKEIDWISLDARRQYMHIRTSEPMTYRLTERCYLRAVCQALSEDGIECNEDVNWH